MRSINILLALCFLSPFMSNGQVAKKKTIEKYAVISYWFKTSDESSGNGQMIFVYESVPSKNGKGVTHGDADFGFNQNYLIDYIKKANKKKGLDDLVEVLILGVIKFHCKQDYDYFLTDKP